MSRAFVNEDAQQGPEDSRHYSLPRREDPSYDEAAAWALLEGANVGDSMSAEAATGYRWGEPTLAPHVARILQHAEASGNERLAQLAGRFLTASKERGDRGI